MRRRKLLIGLMSAGAFTAGFGAAVFPASAQLRTITVTLLGGETVTVQVDEPATNTAPDPASAISTVTDAGTSSAPVDPPAPADTGTSSAPSQSPAPADTSSSPAPPAPAPAPPAPPAAADTTTPTDASPSSAAPGATTDAVPTATDGTPSV